MDSTQTVHAPPADIASVRADLIDQIIDGIQLIKDGAAHLKAAHGNLEFAQYGDVSKAGADRGRLSYAFNQHTDDIEKLAMEVVSTLATLDLPDPDGETA